MKIIKPNCFDFCCNCLTFFVGRGTAEASGIRENNGRKQQKDGRSSAKIGKKLGDLHEKENRNSVGLQRELKLKVTNKEAYLTQ